MPYQGPAINNGGAIAYWAALAGGQATVLKSDGTTTTKIMQTGQPLPGGNGSFSGFINQVAINDLGLVASQWSGTHGVYSGNGVTVTPLGATGASYNSFGFNLAGQASVYTGSAVRHVDPSGSTTTIAFSGQSLPGGVGSFANVYGVSMNDSGEHAFLATLFGPQDNNEGVYKGDGTTLFEIAREGQASPTGIGVYESFGSEQINNSGRVAFAAILRGAGGDDTGLFAKDADGTAFELMRSGHAAPGGGVFIYSDLWGAMSQNSAGHVAFAAKVAGDDGSHTGIYTSDNGELSKIVRAGDPTSDGNREFESVSGSLAFSDNDAIAFVASTINADDQVPSDPRVSLFYFDSARGLIEVVRTGDALLGSTIASIAFAPTNSIAGNEVGGINTQGQVAYFARLEDGRGAMMIATVPEPSAILLIGAIAFGSAVRRRRKI